jgi:undecaprenyl-diphosphatase
MHYYDNSMSLLIIFVGQYLIFIVALVALSTTLLSERTVRNKLIVLAVLSFLIASGIAFVANIFYYDPRPFVIEHITPLIPHAPDNGFPSDHTLFAMVASAVTFVYKRKIGILLGVLAILIGISRVIAGVHHPIDIIGGVIIGIVATGIAWTAMKVLTGKS